MRAIRVERTNERKVFLCLQFVSSEVVYSITSVGFESKAYVDHLDVCEERTTVLFPSITM